MVDSQPMALAGAADRNVARFIWFRLFFNTRFYYPVLAVLFLDYGLSMRQYAVLNFAWAATIVLLEVPSGALADIVGRRRLVVLAAILMVVEMLILCFAPVGASSLLFLLFLTNRIASGAAEAAASGADEALVYDALEAEGRQGEWPRVLERLMRWQSIGFFCAMIAGGLLYDPGAINAALGWLGIDADVTKAITIRLPGAFTLVMAMGALIVSLGFRDAHKTQHGGAGAAVSAAFVGTWESARWIWGTGAALVVIVAAVCCDSVVRLFMTVGSEYYRIIALPPFTFGLIGAGMAALGIVVPPLARWMVGHWSMPRNFMAIAGLVLIALCGIALRLPYWGVVFVLPLGVAMTLIGFMVSHYLNAIAPSKMRATILSFKGLAMNMAFGGISLLFAGLLQLLKTGEGSAFGEALGWLPVYFAVTFAAVALWGFTGKATRSSPLQPAGS